MPPEAAVPAPDAARGPAVSAAEPDPVEEPVHRGWPPGFGSGKAERRAVLVLASLRGISKREVHRLVWRVGSARAAVSAVKAGRAGSALDRSIASGIEVDAVVARLGELQARMVVPGDREYVARLEDLNDPPAALFVRGSSLDDPSPHVAIVGARQCTPYGREVARSMAGRLGGAGCVVVSGGARGIDTASHEGALAGGGRTIAVLGCGIDRAYPAGNSRLLERISASGAVVSEYPPGVPAYPFHFPLRNRLVAALSLGAVVVEGAQGSGSVITADLALDLGRTVMAVPGPVNSALSRAPLKLIRDGAALVRDADDVIADLGITPPPPAAGERDADGAVAAPRGLSDAEARVFRSLVGPTLAEDVARAADLDLRMAVVILLGLELRGLVQSVGGRYMIRPGRPVGG